MHKAIWSVIGVSVAVVILVIAYRIFGGSGGSVKIGDISATVDQKDGAGADNSNSPQVTEKKRVESFTVKATDGWQNTGINVRIGDKVYLKSNGRWSAISCAYHFPRKHKLCKSSIGLLHGADGIEGAIRNYQVNGANLGSLVGKISSDKFYFGSDAEITVLTNGVLELGIEDCYENKGEGSCLKDNNGSIETKITINPK